MNKRKKILGLGALALILGISGTLMGSAEAYRENPNVRGPNYSAERHALMQEAFSSNDYTTWKDLMEGRGRVTQVVNENNFAKFTEVHKLAVSGDLEGAKKIRQELGLGLRNGSGQGMNNKFGKGINRNSGVNR